MFCANSSSNALYPLSTLFQKDEIMINYRLKERIG